MQLGMDTELHVQESSCVISQFVFVGGSSEELSVGTDHLTAAETGLECCEWNRNVLGNKSDVDHTTNP